GSPCESRTPPGNITKDRIRIKSYPVFCYDLKATTRLKEINSSKLIRNSIKQYPMEEGLIIPSLLFI
ncbi:hypothetical protein, partial [Oceanobacillus salinisoli]|uniref:hypothetical protein n=1 Tax=Oceanobacillus salinisoli TaxID=2678611 RepID=UPI001E62B295